MMIRTLACACIALSGCAAMPVICPEPQVTAILCPMLPDTDNDFRAELADELSALPDGTALGQAGRDYIALTRTILEQCRSA